MNVGRYAMPGCDSRNPSKALLSQPLARRCSSKSRARKVARLEPGSVQGVLWNRIGRGGLWLASKSPLCQFLGFGSRFLTASFPFPCPSPAKTSTPAQHEGLPTQSESRNLRSRMTSRVLPASSQSDTTLFRKTTVSVGPNFPSHSSAKRAKLKS
jgi:hypothetical protein